MSETKWPATPWQYQEESDAYTHIVRGVDGKFIGSAPQGTDGKAESTARLWAASPELYAFIERMAREEFFDDSEWGIEAAALLAKARGESA